jgi:hypothetical protein
VDGVDGESVREGEGFQHVQSKVSVTSHKAKTSSPPPPPPQEKDVDQENLRTRRIGEYIKVTENNRSEENYVMRTVAILIFVK